MDSVDEAPEVFVCERECEKVCVCICARARVCVFVLSVRLYGHLEMERARERFPLLCHQKTIMSILLLGLMCARVVLVGWVCVHIRVRECLCIYMYMYILIFSVLVYVFTIESCNRRTRVFRPPPPITPLKSHDSFEKESWFHSNPFQNRLDGFWCLQIVATM